jgi:hypothetical protein
MIVLALLTIYGLVGGLILPEDDAASPLLLGLGVLSGFVLSLAVIL